MSLLDTLQSFLERYSSLESLDDSGENGFAREFSQIQTQSRAWAGTDPLQFASAQKSENVWKNRFKDILPFDQNRVKLTVLQHDSNNDYVNASLIQGVRGSYIASQGPMPSTVEDFWRMVLEHKIAVVVMVCNVREAGKMKCERYWPYEDEQINYHDITVTLVEEDQLSPDYARRRLCVTYGTAEAHLLTQYQYTAWPDHGTPRNYTAILEMLAHIWDHDSSDKRIILVHCSAGCGRTGTICAIDYAWNVLRLTPEAICASLMFDIVIKLRQQRVAMVQTKEQYEFAYRVVADLFAKHRDLILLNEYVNVNHRGELKTDEDFVDLYETIYALPNRKKELVRKNSLNDYEPIYINAIRDTLTRHLPKRPLDLESVTKKYANVRARVTVDGEEPPGEENCSLRTQRPSVKRMLKVFESGPESPKTSPRAAVRYRRKGDGTLADPTPLVPLKQLVPVTDIYAVPHKPDAGASDLPVPSEIRDQECGHYASIDVLNIQPSGYNNSDDRSPGGSLSSFHSTFICDGGYEEISKQDHREESFDNPYSVISTNEVKVHADRSDVCEENKPRTPSPPYKSPRTPPIPVPLSLHSSPGNASQNEVPTDPDYSFIWGNQSSNVDHCARDSLHIDDSYEHYPAEKTPGECRISLGATKSTSNVNADVFAHIEGKASKDTERGLTPNRNEHQRKVSTPNRNEHQRKVSTIFTIEEDKLDVDCSSDITESKSATSIKDCPDHEFRGSSNLNIGEFMASKFYDKKSYGIPSCRSTTSELPPPLPSKCRSKSYDAASSSSKFYRKVSSLTAAISSDNLSPFTEFTTLNDVMSDPRLSAYRLTSSAPDLTDEESLTNRGRASDLTSQGDKRPRVYTRPPSYNKSAKIPLLKKIQLLLFDEEGLTDETHMNISAPIMRTSSEHVYVSDARTDRDCLIIPPYLNLHPHIEEILRRENIHRPPPAQLIPLSRAKDTTLVKNQVQFSLQPEDRGSRTDLDQKNIFSKLKTKFQSNTKAVDVRSPSSTPSHEGRAVHSWYKPTPINVMSSVPTDYPNCPSRKPKGPRPPPWSK